MTQFKAPHSTIDEPAHIQACVEQESLLQRLFRAELNTAGDCRQRSRRVLGKVASAIAKSTCDAAGWATGSQQFFVRLDFPAHRADTYSIYSPPDMPQGLRRGSVFSGSAWEVSHAC